MRSVWAYGRSDGRWRKSVKIPKVRRSEFTGELTLPCAVEFTPGRDELIAAACELLEQVRQGMSVAGLLQRAYLYSRMRNHGLAKWGMYYATHIRESKTSAMWEQASMLVDKLYPELNDE